MKGDPESLFERAHCEVLPPPPPHPPPTPPTHARMHCCKSCVVAGASGTHSFLGVQARHFCVFKHPWLDHGKQFQLPLLFAVVKRIYTNEWRAFHTEEVRIAMFHTLPIKMSTPSAKTWLVALKTTSRPTSRVTIMDACVRNQKTVKRFSQRKQKRRPQSTPKQRVVLTGACAMTSALHLHMGGDGGGLHRHSAANQGVGIVPSHAWDCPSACHDGAISSMCPDLGVHCTALSEHTLCRPRGTS